jgi:hypothetical protein
MDEFDAVARTRGGRGGKVSRSWPTCLQHVIIVLWDVCGSNSICVLTIERENKEMLALLVIAL